MTKARPVFPGATSFSTRRTHKRQLLLTPSRRLNRNILYIAAVLAERYKIKLHALCALSNHVHDVSTDPDGHIVEFQRHFHALLARHVNAMCGEFESLWAREPTCRVDCAEAGDVLDKITYTMANPVAALLVEHGRSWPGVRRAWPAKPKTIRRPRGFFRDEDAGGTWPKEVSLEFHRPPGFDELADAELAARLENASKEREEEVRAEARMNKKRFLGRRRVLTQSRHAYPSSGEQRFKMRPTLAARWKWARVEKLRRNAQWEEEYAASRKALCSGRRDVLFPFGTFKLRRYYRVACRPPPA